MKRVIPIAVAATIALVLWPRQRSAPSLGSTIGRLLRGVRCGDARLTSNDPALRDLPQFDLQSDGFVDGGPMQPSYVGIHGKQPPLRWSGVPAQTVEIALIVEDIDVPFAAPLVHAIAYGIDPTLGMLEAGAIPPPGHSNEHDTRITVGRGTGGNVFLPPTPIPGHGPHRYVFQAFALRERLTFDRPLKKAQLVRALREVAIARAMTVGTHENL